MEAVKEVAVQAQEKPAVAPKTAVKVETAPKVKKTAPKVQKPKGKASVAKPETLAMKNARLLISQSGLTAQLGESGKWISGILAKVYTTLNEKQRTLVSKAYAS